MDAVDRTRALASLAHRGEPPPVDIERRIATAWRLFLSAGPPREPGWTAVQHDTQRSGFRDTAALKLVLEVDLDAAGTLILAGGVGSGRTYAACWMVWLYAWRLAGGGGHRMAKWLDAGDLGLPLDYPRRGSTAPVWSELRDGFEQAGILVLDDLGAAGTEGGITRARELIEARHRAGRLTVVSTNATSDKDLRSLFGSRIIDRAALEVLAGASLRSRKLAPPPPTPTRVNEALERLQAAEDVDKYAQARRAGGQAADIVGGWLRRGTPAEAWEAKLESEVAAADAQAQEIQAALLGVVAGLAGLRCVPDIATLEPETQPRSLDEARDVHAAKVAQLLAEGEA